MLDLYQCDFSYSVVVFKGGVSCRLIIGSIVMETKRPTHELEFAVIVLVLMLIALYILDLLRII